MSATASRRFEFRHVFAAGKVAVTFDLSDPKRVTAGMRPHDASPLVLTILDENEEYRRWVHEVIYPTLKPHLSARQIDIVVNHPDQIETVVL